MIEVVAPSVTIFMFLIIANIGLPEDKLMSLSYLTQNSSFDSIAYIHPIILNFSLIDN